MRVMKLLSLACLLAASGACAAALAVIEVMKSENLPARAEHVAG
jgi:4-aminobutyrate aminotransferase-like enzyme